MAWISGGSFARGMASSLDWEEEGVASELMMAKVFAWRRVVGEIVSFATGKGGCLSLGKLAVVSR